MPPAERMSVTRTVSTVLGPVSSDRLGVVAVHESLLSVLPGAQYAYDVTIDRAEIFEILKDKVGAFGRTGGGTIVDATGMFHGRDLPMYEALSRATGVHIVASTGLGPEECLGGYFLTPQTNPPTPWPAERFAELFEKEITEGMVVPRVERRGKAGLVSVAVSAAGMTQTEDGLVRGAARAAANTGVPLSIRFGRDAVHDLDVVLEEGIPPARVVVAGLDRRDAVAAGWPVQVAARGAYVAIDHVGWNDEEGFVDDVERATLVRELMQAGHSARVLLSSSAIGVSKGHPDVDRDYHLVQSSFVPLLRAHGIGYRGIQQLIVTNPGELLAGAQ